MDRKKKKVKGKRTELEMTIHAVDFMNKLIN